MATTNQVDSATSGIAPEGRVDFATHPTQYKHWQLAIDGRIATLRLHTQEDAPLHPGYELKLNTYDLGVEIELYDAAQRLRFEHPEVAAVVITSGKAGVFSAGANIRMLAQSALGPKINFCKFSNETYHGIEDASAHSGQRYLCAINGTAAGGGYELALICDHILLVDDGASAVSLPEVPLLAVLPGTGGLTRLVDKRHVRHDHADFFCTTAEGLRGKRALDWGFVDELAPRSQFEEVVQARAQEFAAKSDRPTASGGITLTPLLRTLEPERLTYTHVTVALDRELSTASFMIHGPQAEPPQDLAALHAAGASFWPLAVARELDDAILHLRENESAIGTWVFRSTGDHARVAAAETALLTHAEDWLVREIVLYLKRVWQRLDVSARSLMTLIKPGSCFGGLLLECVLAADRSYMLDGTCEDSPLPPATVRVSPLNDGPLPMITGLTRLERRCFGVPERLDKIRQHVEQELDAEAAEALGLVTFIPDDIDWADEVRLALEERASFSPDALSGLEASLRFAGPETLQSKIFARLSTWQNWIFQRPNASGAEGALTLYGTGKKSLFDKRRT